MNTKTVGPAFYKSLAAIALPVALQNLISFSVNLMDTIMLGSLGEVALSASSLANQVFFIYTVAVFVIASGATVLVIEHDLDVIRNADHIIDIGPDGGERGGNIVAVGTPEEVSRCNEGFTAKYLREKLLSCTDIGRHI